MVTTEEFERVLEILAQRNRHPIAKRRYSYLLKGLVYVENDRGRTAKLTCSTPNLNRKGGGTAYYCVWSSNINIRCDIVDGNVADSIGQIQVDASLMPAIRNAYSGEVAKKLGQLRPSEHEQLEAALKAVDEEEARTARLYASGKITDHIWNNLWEEWQDRRMPVLGNGTGGTSYPEACSASTGSEFNPLAPHTPEGLSTPRLPVAYQHSLSRAPPCWSVWCIALSERTTTQNRVLSSNSRSNDV